MASVVIGAAADAEAASVVDTAPDPEVAPAVGAALDPAAIVAAVGVAGTTLPSPNTNLGSWSRSSQL
jgi:hypothetical protein